MNLLKYLDSLFLILMHLCNQFVHRIELDFRTEVFNEFQTHLLVVDVAFEVEDMHFDTEVIAIVEGWTITDTQHAFPLLAGYLNTNRIDSNGRNQFVGEIHLKVSSREADFTAYLVAINYNAFEEVIVS